MPTTIFTVKKFIVKLQTTWNDKGTIFLTIFKKKLRFGAQNKTKIYMNYTVNNVNGFRQLTLLLLQA